MWSNEIRGSSYISTFYTSCGCLLPCLIPISEPTKCRHDQISNILKLLSHGQIQWNGVRQVPLCSWYDLLQWDPGSAEDEPRGQDQRQEAMQCSRKARPKLLHLLGIFGATRLGRDQPSSSRWPQVGTSDQIQYSTGAVKGVRNSRVQALPCIHSQSKVGTIKMHRQRFKWSHCYLGNLGEGCEIWLTWQGFGRKNILKYLEMCSPWVTCWA